MIEWLIGFLAAKWYMDKEDTKEKKQAQEFSGNIEYTIPFGYVRDGESVRDLQ